LLSAPQSVVASGYGAPSGAPPTRLAERALCRCGHLLSAYARLKHAEIERGRVGDQQRSRSRLRCYAAREDLPRYLCLRRVLAARRQMPLRTRRREGNTPTSGTPPPIGISESAYFFALAAGKEVAGAIAGTPVAAVGLRLYLARIGAKSGWVRPYSVSLTTKSFISGALTLW
jgi:hypothetical protein